MKILDMQAGILSNWEVHKHLTKLRVDYKADGRKGPGNLETVVRELLVYLEMAPSPLRDKSLNWSKRTLSTLMARLRPYDLTKSEILMVINLRPTSAAALGTVIEEMENRFPESETQENILQIIAEVLGRPDEEAEKVAMNTLSKEVKGNLGAEESMEMDEGP